MITSLFAQQVVPATDDIHESKFYIPVGCKQNKCLYRFQQLCGLAPTQIVPGPNEGQGLEMVGVSNHTCAIRRKLRNFLRSVKLAPPTGCTSTPWPRAFCTASCAELPSSWSSNNAGLKPATTLLSQKPQLIVNSMKHI